MSGSTTKHEATSVKGVASCVLAMKKFSLHQIGPALLLAIAAAVSVLTTIDLADDLSWSADGPGLTFDESLNVEGGVFFVELALRTGIGMLHPGTYYDIFNTPEYHPDYPPLGRLPGAAANAVLGRLWGTNQDSLYIITYARVGTACVFGLLIGLVTWFTTTRAGIVSGIAAGIALWFTPRVFGHAHLASVETMVNLTYAGCILGTAMLLSSKEKLTGRDGIVPGILLGLALLTKIQAIFLPPVLTVWILWHWKKNGITALVVLAVTSFIVFLAGWPWLWADPIGRFVQYFSQATDRVTLYCYYFGQRYADKAVPWHYPFVMFLVTTPIPILFLGLFGTTLSRRSADQEYRGLSLRENRLLAAAVLLPLVVFAIPGVAVYDGERLFLMIWPLFSVWVGIAAGRIFDLLQKRVHLAAGIMTLVACFAFPAWQLVSMHPCQLSYYNGLVGGVSGATRLGMEPTYWGDSLAPQFLREISDQLPEGATVGIAPVLHPIYLDGTQKQSWLRHRPDLKIVPFDDKAADPPRYVLFVRRLADPWDSLINKQPGTKMLAEFKRGGVPLAELVLLAEPNTGAVQTME
ncbi:ArnT family glycosyltransferase [Planctomicrobium sp. SH527]|uniref:ArnT family glycosyltransferase n=1 Tax=Planctomicrobium sp. SH527 TaxID=3448123 RepID=UPI003F5BBB41